MSAGHNVKVGAAMTFLLLALVFAAFTRWAIFTECVTQFSVMYCVAAH